MKNDVMRYVRGVKQAQDYNDRDCHLSFPLKDVCAVSNWVISVQLKVTLASGESAKHFHVDYS